VQSDGHGTIRQVVRALLDAGERLEPARSDRRIGLDESATSRCWLSSGRPGAEG
jgi:hypothetical protein